MNQLLSLFNKMICKFDANLKNNNKMQKIIKNKKKQ